MEFCTVGPEDLETIAIISEQHLTHGKKILEEIRHHRNLKDYFGVKAVEKGEMIGFYTCIENDIVFTLPHPEMKSLIEKMTAGEKTITGDTLYVKPAWRGKGIASELAKRVTAMARERDGKYFLTEAWIHPEGVTPAKKIVVFNGEVIFEKIIPFFYRDLSKYGMECPICGKDCRCGAQVQLHRL
jgi:GNAT superfamily N-acetyltransferase